jgi:hypothetical protein
MVTDRPRSEDNYDVAGTGLAVENADFVARREDVGQHERILVRDAIGQPVNGVIGKRHPGEFGLHTVVGVAEDPAALAALPVATLAAEPARAARGYARHEDTVALPDGPDAVADLLDSPDGLVTEDPAGQNGRHIAFKDVQVRAADRGGVHADDSVSVVGDLRVPHILPGLLAWPVVDNRAHDHRLLSLGPEAIVIPAVLIGQGPKSPAGRAECPRGSCAHLSFGQPVPKVPPGRARCPRRIRAAAGSMDLSQPASRLDIELRKTREGVGMRAQVGDRLIVEGDHARTGLVIGVRNEDGSPPYVIRWLANGHIALIFPTEYSRIVPSEG